MRLLALLLVGAAAAAGAAVPVPVTAAAGEYEVVDHAEEFPDCVYGEPLGDDPIVGAPSQRSALWGTAGDRWSPDGRLLDWSYAGYGAGEVQLPDGEVTTDVTKFGAKGDDGKDDTDAFVKALEAAPDGGVVLVPCGTYDIRGVLTIKRPLTLRGEGRACAVLRFPASLADLFGKTRASTVRATNHSCPATDPYVHSSVNASRWAVDGAFIVVQGQAMYNGKRQLTRVTSDAKRGENELRVESTKGIQAGEWVVLAVRDRNGNLMRDVNFGMTEGCIECKNGRGAHRHVSRVADVKGGDTIVLERPLPWNASAGFEPTLYRWAPDLSGVGIEHLTIRMKARKYQGHYHEDGFNALIMQRVANGWVRDVEIEDADLGVLLLGTHFVTLTGVTVSENEYRKGAKNLQCHHGIWVKGGSDVLVEAFEFRGACVHDLSVEGYASGTVFSRGRGVDLSLDHHGIQPYATLWTDLDVGEGRRTWVHGGTGKRMPFAGALTTAWSLRANNPLQAPQSNLGVMLNLVGVGKQGVKRPGNSYGPSWFVENLTPAKMQPQNLYEAQTKVRMRAPNKVSARLGGRGQGGCTTLQFGDACR